jgi:uncharacterized protein
MKHILITGGTGMVGQRLTTLLLEKGHQVAYFSRKGGMKGQIKAFEWNIEAQTLDEKALEWADVVVHLAGAGIADARWTDARKKEIIDSRVKPISMIEKVITDKNLSIEAFISASGIGFYGGDTQETENTETSPAGADFLATCTKLWEEAVENLGQKTGIRTVRLRTGVVLSNMGGALPKLVMPVKFLIGSPLGNGQQWLSWIHIDDLCQLFIEAIEKTAHQSVINAVAPEPIRNTDLTKHIAKQLNKPLWAPNVPAFVLKLLFGEMAVAILGSSKVTSKFLKNSQFKFPTAELALKDLL